MLTTFDACPTKCDDKSQEENDAPIKTPFFDLSLSSLI
jgi:hypothetical protein